MTIASFLQHHKRIRNSDLSTRGNDSREDGVCVCVGGVGLAGKDHSFQSFRMLGLVGLGYKMNLISSLKEKQGSLCLIFKMG